MTAPNRPPGAGLAPAGGGLWPAHIPRPHVPAPAPVVPGDAPPAAGRFVAPPGVRVLVETFTERFPWRGVKWTMTYVGFLGYVFAITTYRLPIGNVSMIIGLLGLLMEKEKIRVPGILKGLGVFLLWCIIGFALTSYPGYVLERLELAGKVWLVALVAANAMRTRAQIRFAIVFWLGCFALYPVRGSLFNYYVYHETMVGRAYWNYIFANPNDVAAYCVLILSLAFGLLSLERKGPVRLATIIGLVVVPFLVLLTKSRGGFLGMAVFVLLALLGQRRRGKAFVVVGLLAALVIGLAPENVLNRVRGLKDVEAGNLREADEEGSAFQRYEIWKVARTIIRENPVAGVGLGAYPLAHQRVSQRPTFDQTARGPRDTHSTYLNVTAETGLVGAAIFFSTYVMALLQLNGVRKRAKKLLPGTSQLLYVYLAGVIGFFVTAVFGSMAHVSFLILHVIVMWVIAEAVRQELDDVKKGRLIVAPAEPPVPRRRVAR
jgi:O-antigen ligase